MEIERVGIDYVLVYPERGLKDEYINRCKNNGSSQGFISKLDKNWDLFMKNVDYESIINKGRRFSAAW